VVSRHREAVAQSLAWAHAAAAAGDYDEALAWLATVTCVASEVHPEWEVQRQAWEAERAREGRDCVRVSPYER
jgi:hypothetical protein